MVSIYHIIGVSIDGDKRVSKDNEGKNAGITPKKDSMLAKLNAIVVDAAQKSDAKEQNDDGGIAKNPDADPAAILVAKRDNSAKNVVPDHGIRSLEETLINSMGYLPSEDKDLEVDTDGITFYTVFSTDCGAFQHWQSYLLFFSAVRIKQTGFITRIASGCTEKQKQEAKEWHQEVSKMHLCECETFLSTPPHLFLFILTLAICSILLQCQADSQSYSPPNSLI